MNLSDRLADGHTGFTTAISELAWRRPVAPAVTGIFTLAAASFALEIMPARAAAAAIAMLAIAMLLIGIVAVVAYRAASARYYKKLEEADDRDHEARLAEADAIVVRKRMNCDEEEEGGPAGAANRWEEDELGVEEVQE